MSYLEEIALKDSKTIINKLAEDGLNHIATLTLAYRSRVYLIKEDPQKIFGEHQIIDAKVKEIFERNDGQYKVTMRQRRGEKTFKIYYGGN